MKAKPEQTKEGGNAKREKLSLHGLSIEDAIRAAARTGPPSPAALHENYPFFGQVRTFSVRPAFLHEELIYPEKI